MDPALPSAPAPPAPADDPLDLLAEALLALLVETRAPAPRARPPAR